MDKKSFKKNLSILLIIISLISFLYLYNASQKDLLISENNGFGEETLENLKLGATIEPDWEVERAKIETTSCTINKPSGTQEGDLLILHFSLGAETTINGPANWTELLPENQNTQTTASWYKIANASEPIDYTITWSGDQFYVGGIIRITGHNRDNPIQATGEATGKGAVINPSVSTTEDDTLIIGFHGLAESDAGDNYTDDLESGPTALYARTAIDLGSPDDGVSAGMYYEIQASSGASSTRTWSVSGNKDWYAATIAINPAIYGINIIEPIENEIFETLSPNFTIVVPISNIDTMWYTLNGGDNFIFTENGTINQGAWDAVSDGTVTIRFYVENTFGDIGFKEVNVIKDTSAPSINIISPTENEEFGYQPPDFEVLITDLNLNKTWYTIFNSTYESSDIFFTENGSIDQTEWEALDDGQYTLKFYANDTLGNENSEEVNIIKDAYAIVINILSPSENDVFSFDAPSFVVEIYSYFLNTTWYTINGGNKFIFTDNGTIDETTWDALSDGTITIGFYANNSLGENNFELVNVVKDTIAPTINIISPIEDELFGVKAPEFEVDIVDLHLDKMWYTIDADPTKYFFIEDGKIDQAAWDTLGTGNYTLEFYANDTIGNNDSENVNITKDLDAIFIDIYDPIENEFFGYEAPNFIVEISCGSLNTTWYTLEGGSSIYTFTTNGSINEAAWDALLDGTITIEFYANNSLGDINSEDVNVIKDTTAPTISIISPTEEAVFEETAPDFQVEITDPYLDEMWYTINDDDTIYDFTQNGTIDQTAWDVLENGNVTLTFYANDVLGNIAFEEIIIVKNIPPEDTTDDGIIIVIVVVSIVGGVAAVGVILFVLVKKGRVPVEKLAFWKKNSTE